MDGNYLPTDYQSFIHKSTLRQMVRHGRSQREWHETVSGT